MTDNNRRARFYALTKRGHRELEAGRSAWDRIAATMHTLLNQAP